MPAPDLSPFSGRYLSFREREEIALLRVQGKGVREIARHLDRSPSTISRELRRNAGTRGGVFDYRASVAQWKAELFAQHPKVAKMVANEALEHYVQERLAGQIRHPNGTFASAPHRDHGMDETNGANTKIVNGSRDGVRSRFPSAFGLISPGTHQ